MKNEFRIVEKMELTDKGVITYYLAQHRVRFPDEEQEPKWLSARSEYGREMIRFGDYLETRFPSIEKAMERIELAKKSLKYSQYEKTVYTE